MSKYNKLWVTLSMMVSLGLAGTDGTIRGKVTDDKGEPLPGANIYIPALSIGAAADQNGNYILLNIPVGDHDVVAQMMGYRKETVTDVSVMMDQTVWLNLNFLLNKLKVRKLQY